MTIFLMLNIDFIFLDGGENLSSLADQMYVKYNGTQYMAQD